MDFAHIFLPGPNQPHTYCMLDKCASAIGVLFCPQGVLNTQLFFVFPTPHRFRVIKATQTLRTSQVVTEP